MVAVKTADGGFEVTKGLGSALKSVGVGIRPRRDVLGQPLISYG